MIDKPFQLETTKANLMRTILTIIFITLATHVSAWSESIKRMKVDSLHDRITLYNGISFEIPQYIETDDGEMNEVGRSLALSMFGRNVENDPLYFRAALRFNSKPIFSVATTSVPELQEVGQDFISEASEEDLSDFLEGIKLLHQEAYKQVGHEMTYSQVQRIKILDKHYLYALFIWKVDNEDISDKPFNRTTVSMYFADYDNSFRASFNGLGDLTSEVQYASFLFANTLQIP